MMNVLRTKATKTIRRLDEMWEQLQSEDKDVPLEDEDQKTETENGDPWNLKFENDNNY